MRRKTLIVFSIIVLAAIGSAQTKTPRRNNPTLAEQQTAKYLDSIRAQHSLLLEFLRAMPKGGDLHNHLTGAVYAESLIDWAVEDGVCVDRKSVTFVRPPCKPEEGVTPAEVLLTDTLLYRQVLNAISMRAFVPGPESGHDHFFNTFGKFGLVSREHMGEELAEVVSRAGRQNVSYMELILAPDKGESGKLGNEVGWDSNLDNLRNKMVVQGLSEAVSASQRHVDDAEAQMRELLSCSSANADPGCNVTLRYQVEVHRGLPREVVFAEMLVGFELASSDPRFVDINLVMPEDEYVEMHDFNLHMEMLEYLRKLYPRVRLSLHAGELAPGLVPPDGLRFHIRDSIEKGGATRIGHGVDVMYEDRPYELLNQMAQRGIAVEICLTSNDKILEVRGDRHPLPIYLKFGVPVSLATDDEGVARSDITQEFLRAVETYNLSYSQLKTMVRDSVEHSFLQGESLWGDSRRMFSPLQACAAGPLGKNPPPAACKKLLDSSPKAALQWKLEGQFAHFESQSCCTFKSVPPFKAD